MAPWGSKFIVDNIVGKDTRHRLEDRERRRNAQAQGMSQRQYERMAGFDIPAPTAGPVSCPRRLPYPPRQLMGPGPFREPIHVGPRHPIRFSPPHLQEPFDQQHHHPGCFHPIHRGGRIGRPLPHYLEEEDDDYLSDFDDDDVDDDDDDDYDFLSDIDSIRSQDRRSYIRRRPHGAHGLRLVHQDPRAIMPPRGRPGMHGDPYGRGVYGNPYAMGGHQRGYSDTSSVISW
ncbi:MAG: hypothetical protein Q9218_005437 [Villophora microphyllina]